MMTEETDVANVKETIVSCDEKAATSSDEPLRIGCCLLYTSDAADE